MLQNSSLRVLIRSCTLRKYSPIPLSKPEHDAEQCPKTLQDDPPSNGDEQTLKIVSWDGPDDPENPLNLPLIQKIIITLLIDLYTWSIYVGSSLYTSTQDAVMAKFGVGHVEAPLGLALYVLAYGLGALLFSPLSEIPAIGRSPPYVVSGILFVLLSIPTSLVDSFAGLMVLRFLIGFMGSPALATAGASLADIWGPVYFPYAIALWAATTALGPSLGPPISSFAVEALGWRWSSWELLIIAGVVYALFFCLVPETSAPTILYYRAKQRREVTGDITFRSEEEAKSSNGTLGIRLWNSMIKPWEINVRDPAVLFTSFYFGLLYGIYYSFFEVRRPGRSAHPIPGSHEIVLITNPYSPSHLSLVPCTAFRLHQPPSSSWRLFQLSLSGLQSIASTCGNGSSLNWKKGLSATWRICSCRAFLQVYSCPPHCSCLVSRRP